jgi:DNA-directed RNA polymerase specialized sigma24 family protein
MGIPMGTVKSRIFHARQKLSKLLVDFQWGLSI